MEGIRVRSTSVYSATALSTQRRVFCDQLKIQIKYVSVSPIPDTRAYHDRKSFRPLLPLDCGWRLTGNIVSHS